MYTGFTLTRKATFACKHICLTSPSTKAAIKDLPYHLRPQPALFQLLAAANKSAREAVPVHKAYTYVDLTHKDVLPLWMGSEAVGGHTPRPGEFDWDLNADTASLGALGRAL